MNCLYFTVWAQNQLRSGNNKQSCSQLYSLNHLLCCQDNAPLYATWKPGRCDCRNSRQLSTWLGDPRVLGLHHQRQPGPRTHPLPSLPTWWPLKTPGWGLTAEPLFSSCIAPRRAGLLFLPVFHYLKIQVGLGYFIIIHLLGIGLKDFITLALAIRYMAALGTWFRCFHQTRVFWDWIEVWVHTAKFSFYC